MINISLGTAKNFLSKVQDIILGFSTILFTSDSNLLLILIFRFFLFDILNKDFAINCFLKSLSIITPNFLNFFF